MASQQGDIISEGTMEGDVVAETQGEGDFKARWVCLGKSYQSQITLGLANPVSTCDFKAK